MRGRATVVTNMQDRHSVHKKVQSSHTFCPRLWVGVKRVNQLTRLNNNKFCHSPTVLEASEMPSSEGE